MVRKIFDSVYINYNLKTVGMLSCDGKKYKFKYSDEFREFISRTDEKFLLEEGFYDVLPLSILNRTPKQPEEKEMKAIYGYKLNFYEPITWLKLMGGFSLNDFYSFSEEPIEENYFSNNLEEIIQKYNKKKSQRSIDYLLRIS